MSAKYYSMKPKQEKNSTSSTLLTWLHIYGSGQCTNWPPQSIYLQKM